MAKSKRTETQQMQESWVPAFCHRPRARSMARDKSSKRDRPARSIALAQTVLYGRRLQLQESPESSEAKQSRLRRKHNKSLYRSRKARSGLLSLATRVPEVDFNMKPRSNWNAPSRSFLSNSS